MIGTKIKGTGSYVPKRVLSNIDLEKIVDTNDEWVYTRTGIKERRIVTNENTSDLAYNAALRALEDANLKSTDIDLLIVATTTPDNYFPGVANILQNKLNMREVMTFDMNAACTGFLYALNIADKMIKSGSYQNALVIGAEVMSKIIDWSDRNTCVLFGDGAGAVVLSKSKENKLLDIFSKSKGDLNDLLRLEGFTLKTPENNEKNLNKEIKMKGRDVFKFATRVLPESINELLINNNLTLDDIDKVIAHQANERIIDKAARDLKIEKHKMFINISKYGNTSAASIPIAIDEAIKEKALKKGDLFITAAFGAGLTWAAALIEL